MLVDDIYEKYASFQVHLKLFVLFFLPNLLNCRYFALQTWTRS